MAQKEDISSSLLSLDRVEQRGPRSSRFFVFNRSPLARKIILFNLIALGILVSGVLYLNQSQDTQVNFRSDALGRQAEIISAAIRSHAGDPDYEDLNGATFKAFFESMVVNSDSIIQVYSKSGEVALSFVPQERPKSSEGLDTDIFTRFFQRIWSSLTIISISSSSEGVQQNLERHLNELAVEAIAVNGRTKNVVLSIEGEIFIAVALPIQAPEGAEGAILVSTREGEVDTIIRTAREQILQMFLLATISSIVLSIVLANSIARPLRRLSAAAQNAQDEAGEKLNLARVNIPDLSARPDEIGDLSRSMRNMTDALLERIDQNKSFAADVSHEIKNPLTSLRSAVETLGYVDDDESRTALLGVIQNDVDRLDRLVTDISNASRLEGELVRDTWETIDICAMLQELMHNFEARGGYPDVRFLYETSVKNCTIRGLTSRLDQVFSNLISNALSFVPADGWVKMSISETRDFNLLIEVSDNGPGIPEENLSDVFTRFYSERPVEQFGEHSGLGLAISKQIIEAHGGSITASNTDANGALFSVKLPM
ncbi:MAG TPA: HAMP domain-containing protein [Rhodobacteraceae bacterium]|nr:HAMP domain-containing protein [Paracoccaceae bacterium]